MVIHSSHQASHLVALCIATTGTLRVCLSTQPYVILQTTFWNIYTPCFLVTYHSNLPNKAVSYKKHYICYKHGLVSIVTIQFVITHLTGGQKL